MRRIIPQRLYWEKCQEQNQKSKRCSRFFYFHINMKPGCRLNIPLDPTHNAFIYVISGSIETEGRKQINTNQVVLYERGGNEVELFSSGGSEILLLGGRPHNEPVYAYGPFVMNTEEQITKCYRDYQSGKMGNPELVNR